jgi:hypothetical protein
MEIIGFICTVIVLAEIGYLFYAFVMSKFTKDETITIECTEEDLKLLNEIKERRKNNEARSRI